MPSCIVVIVTKFLACERFYIFTKKYCQITCYTLCVTLVCVCWRTNLWNVVKKDKILIKVLRVEKGYGAKKIITKFHRKNCPIVSVNHLLRQTDLMAPLYLRIIDTAVNQWSQRLQDCIRENREHFEHRNLTFCLIRSEQTALYSRTIMYSYLTLDFCLML